MKAKSRKLVSALLALIMICGLFAAMPLGTTGASMVVMKTPEGYNNTFSVGYSHSAMIASDGSLYTWGSNSTGQLGLGDYTDRNTPTKVGLSDVVAVNMGCSHSAAITSDGRLYIWGNHQNHCESTDLSEVVSVSLGAWYSAALTADGSFYTWGSNEYGQLGLGDNEYRNTPTKVGLSDVVAVSLGYGHSAAVTSDGSLYIWGWNDYGQLGLGDNEYRNTPTKVLGLSDVVAVSLIGYHSAAVTSDGSLYSWGKNDYGQLGLGDKESRNTPTKVGLSEVVAVSLGGFHSAAVTADGSLYTWGHNKYGQLGLGDSDNRNTPTKVNLSDVAAVSLGWENSAAATSDGKFYTWGKNEYGELGLGDNENRNTPQPMDVPTALTGPTAMKLYEGYKAKSSGVFTGIGYPAPTVTASGDSKIKWNEATKELDIGEGLAAGIYPVTLTASNGVDPPATLTFTLTVTEAIILAVPLSPTGPTANTFSLGGSHSAAVTSNGSLYTWGDNYSGKLGLSDNSDKNTPTKVPWPSDVVAVSLGGSHSAAVTSDGSLYTWGRNWYGELGMGVSADKNTPTKVGLSDVVAVSLGSGHSAAVTSDSSLYTWGRNEYGQLGLGDNEDKYTPRKIAGLSNVVAVSLGSGHSAAITSDGSLYTWGHNKYGQLGLGDNADRNTPTKVPGLSNVVAVSLGDYHSAAVTSDGSLYTWGSNYRYDSHYVEYAAGPILVSHYYGQLGLGDKADRNTPTKVRLSDVVAVSLGGFHSAAVTSDGGLYTWGDNESGQLGLGDNEDRDTPTKVSGLSNVAAVNLGGWHSAAVTSDGSLYTWGDNYSGQLGLGEDENRNTPQPVLIERSDSFPFTDVPADQWYHDSVRDAWQMGLISGKSATRFAPDSDLTYAEAVKLAACMHQLYTNGTVTLAPGSPNWYDSYVDYAVANGIIASADAHYWYAQATRAGYMAIFANALPESALPEINAVADGSIPDVSADHPQAWAIYRLYRAGIVAGVDAERNCNPDANIRRSEVAAILVRMMDPAERKPFSLP